MTALDRSQTLEPGLGEPSEPAGDVAGLQHPPAANDYSGHLARLLVLLATFAVAYGLHTLAGGRPYFGFLVLSGVILTCIGLLLGPQSQFRSARMAVPLFDLAWITFAMHLSSGLNVFLLPGLYIVIAMVAMRGDRWEIGTTLAGVITGIVILLSADKSGSVLTLAVAQATLLAAGALAIRLTIGASSSAVAMSRNQQLYETLLNKTSDAVFALTPDDWRVIEANPAGRTLFDGQPETDLHERPLGELVRFTDDAFLRACRAKLAAGEPVVDAVTYAQDAEGHKVLVRCNMTPVQSPGSDSFVQAIMEIVEEPEQVLPTSAVRDDFIVNYIPTLTHELNNHLAAIRLSAEFAADTGRMPDFQQIQQQVDRCQDVLQTVVLQILRSSAPVVVPEKLPEADVRTVLERCLLLTRPQVLSQGVQLRVDIPPDLPKVVGFTHELQEAMARVVLQSVERMAAQETARALTITATGRPTRVDIVVTDTGPGLGSRELYIISGKQVAVSRAGDRAWEAVRDSVCRFGGDAQASNGLHGGMRLRFSLPVAVPEQVVS